jgi:hypothetical protein
VPTAKPATKRAQPFRREDGDGWKTGSEGDVMVSIGRYVSRARRWGRNAGQANGRGYELKSSDTWAMETCVRELSAGMLLEPPLFWRIRMSTVSPVTSFTSVDPPSW